MIFAIAHERMEISNHLISDSSILAWVSLFMKVIGFKATDPIFDEKSGLWKAKKWAYASVNSLYGRFPLQF